MYLLEAVAVPDTIAKFFEAVGETVTGLISSAANVFSGLWTSGIPGQLICTLGFASMVIGFGCAIFRIRRGRRR